MLSNDEFRSAEALRVGGGGRIEDVAKQLIYFIYCAQVVLKSSQEIRFERKFKNVFEKQLGLGIKVRNCKRDE